MIYALCAIFLVCGFVLGQSLAHESWRHHTCYHFDECSRYGCADDAADMPCHSRKETP